MERIQEDRGETVAAGARWATMNGERREREGKGKGEDSSGRVNPSDQGAASGHGDEGDGGGTMVTKTDWRMGGKEEMEDRRRERRMTSPDESQTKRQDPTSTSSLPLLSSLIVKSTIFIEWNSKSHPSWSSLSS
jgi:hypothetical protein